MTLTFDMAEKADAGAIAELRTTVAAQLTRDFGYGHWSGEVTERGVLRDLNKTAKTSRVLLARANGSVVATLRLATKKPWAIDVKYFTDVPRPIYLLDMAVHPDLQRRGIGRRLLDQATAVVRTWPGQAIRLDAYDAPAGAAGFYSKCGYREIGRVRYRNVPLVYFELLM